MRALTHTPRERHIPTHTYSHARTRANTVGGAHTPCRPTKCADGGDPARVVLYVFREFQRRRTSLGEDTQTHTHTLRVRIPADGDSSASACITVECVCAWVSVRVSGHTQRWPRTAHRIIFRPMAVSANAPGRMPYFCDSSVLCVRVCVCFSARECEKLNFKNAFLCKAIFMWRMPVRVSAALAPAEMV